MVTLRLVSLRIGEVGPLLFPQLRSLGQALRAAGDTLQQWSPLFQSAAAVLHATEDAHQQAVSLQVSVQYLDSHEKARYTPKAFKIMARLTPGMN